MADKTTHSRSIKSVHTLFDIIEIIYESDCVTVTDIANELDMSASTVTYHLNTLTSREYVTKEPDGYRLSYKFLEYGIKLRKSRLQTVARPELERLSEETGATSWLLVEDNGRSAHIDKIEGDKAAPSRAHLGERTSLHDHSAGKVILAYLPEERVDEIIETRGLPKRTENTITTREELLEELESIREQGYAINDNEYTQGLRAVSAPILHEEELIGAVGLSDASHRMRNERFHTRIPDLVKGAADSIVLSLKYD
jgi:DNA-binding IclR family transcriptional regulator